MDRGVVGAEPPTWLEVACTGGGLAFSGRDVAFAGLGAGVAFSGLGDGGFEITELETRQPHEDRTVVLLHKHRARNVDGFFHIQF
jgi:hypothetical protein